MKKRIRKEGMNFINEFSTFIKRGNVIDLAVGVIIGGAFGKIVSSLVDDILMPVIGVIIGGIDFSSLTIKFGDATIKYGVFINNIINFLIVALCIFILVKFINKLTPKKEEKKEAPKKPEDIVLLEKILEELKQKNKKEKK